MTLKGFVLLICLVTVQISFAQQLPKSIIKIMAFQQTIQMGNIPVDEGGKPLRNGLDTTLFIFIETKTNMLPKWQKAYKNGITYTLSLTDSTNSQSNELIATRGYVLKAAAGNKLWRYDLVMEDNKKACVSTKNTITLEGKYNGKKIIFPIKNITTLEPELRP